MVWYGMYRSVVLVIVREGGGGLVAGKEEGATVSWHLEAQGMSPRSMRGVWPEMMWWCAAALLSVSA
jgi:hypothetical protein